MGDVSTILYETLYLGTLFQALYHAVYLQIEAGFRPVYVSTRNKLIKEILQQCGEERVTNNLVMQKEPREGRIFN
jgi:hypothetical protein